MWTPPRRGWWWAPLAQSFTASACAARPTPQLMPVALWQRAGSMLQARQPRPHLQPDLGIVNLPETLTVEHQRVLRAGAPSATHLGD